MNRRLIGALSLLTLGLCVGPAFAQDGTEDAPTAPAEPAEPAGTTVEAPEATDVAPADDPGYNRDLRTVEQEVTSLKERVFRSKATLQLLRELVIEGAALGSRLVLWHVDKMSPSYTTESIQYFLDGKNVYAKLDPTGGLDDLKEFQVLERAVPPGTHSLQVNVALRGNGFGVFSYLNTYTFKVQSSYTFNVEDGRMSVVRVVLDEKGGIARRFVDRPNVSYEERGEVLRAE